VDEAFLNLLDEKRDVIAMGWRDAAFSSYSPEAARFMGREKNEFANPVGTIIGRACEELLKQLISTPDSATLDALIGDVMQIRAVQEFRPEKAVGFVFALKPVVRKALNAQKLEPRYFEALLEFESRIDDLMLRAFEAYVISRERVYDIKANELRRRSERVIEKLNERLFARAQESDGSERGGTQ
jgi:hypothetical protein